MGTARAVVVAVALTLGAVACGSNGAPPSAAGETANQGAAGDAATQGGGGSQGSDLTDIDVCTLLSREEIQSAVGNAVDDGTSLPFVCSWDSNTLEDVAVTLGVFPDFPGTTVEPCEAARDPEAVSVGSGAVGDGSYWSFRQPTESLSFASFEVCSGHMAFSVDLAGQGEEGTMRTASQTLASLVLGRI